MVRDAKKQGFDLKIWFNCFFSLLEGTFSTDLPHVFTVGLTTTSLTITFSLQVNPFWWTVCLGILVSPLVIPLKPTPKVSGSGAEIILLIINYVWRYWTARDLEIQRRKMGSIRTFTYLRWRCYWVAVLCTTAWTPLTKMQFRIWGDWPYCSVYCFEISSFDAVLNDLNFLSNLDFYYTRPILFTAWWLKWQSLSGLIKSQSIARTTQLRMLTGSSRRSFGS